MNIDDSLKSASLSTGASPLSNSSTSSASSRSLENFIPSSTEETSSLSLSHITSHPPSSRIGVVEAVVTFLKRYFWNRPIEKEKRQAKTIHDELKDLKRILNQFEIHADKTKHLEGQLSRLPLSSAHHVDTTSAFEQAKKILQDAQNQVTLLSSQQNEEILRGLKNYARYDFLQEEIERAKNQVQYLKGRVAVHEKLQELEEKIKNYEKSGKTWEFFSEINQQRGELAKVLKEVVQDQKANPEKSVIRAYEKAILPYIEKESLSAQETYEVIKRIYPGLTPKIERLFNEVLAIQQERVQALSQRMDGMEILISEYRTLAMETNGLEAKLNDYKSRERGLKTTGDGDGEKDIISIFSDRLANSQAEKLKIQMSEIQKSIEKNEKLLKTTYEVLDDDQVNKEEKDWLKRVVKKSPQDKPIENRMEHMHRLFSHLEWRQEISTKMDVLISSLQNYKTSKTDSELNAISQNIKESVAIIRWESEFLLKQEIKHDVPFKKAKSEIKKLQLSMQIAFPSLQSKLQGVIDFIQREGMGEIEKELKEAIENAWKKPAESPPRPTAVDSIASSQLISQEHENKVVEVSPLSKNDLTSFEEESSIPQEVLGQLSEQTENSFQLSAKPTANVTAEKSDQPFLEIVDEQPTTPHPSSEILNQEAGIPEPPADPAGPPLPTSSPPTSGASSPQPSGKSGVISSDDLRRPLRHVSEKQEGQKSKEKKSEMQDGLEKAIRQRRGAFDETGDVHPMDDTDSENDDWK